MINFPDVRIYQNDVAQESLAIKGEQTLMYQKFIYLKKVKKQHRECYTVDI